MAVGHYQYNAQSPMGALLRSAMTHLETGRDQLRQVVGAMIQMKDGGVFTSYIVGQFGFSDVTSAAAAEAELESFKAALEGIVAAFDQACAKFRNG